MSDKVGGLTFEMIEIKGGTFLMGDSPGEPPHDDPLLGASMSAGPRHKVTLSDFYLGKYEVTQALWREVAALPKVKIDLEKDPSRNFEGNDLPVHQVSWQEAVEFCDRLSRATGNVYRLPTEAEWEYSCRAGTTSVYAGNLDEMCWYGLNSGVKPLTNKMVDDALNSKDRGAYSSLIDDNKGRPHPVGQKQPNAWGLYDMHGNISEWCQDWLDSYSASDQKNPMGPAGGSHIFKVFRGGDYFGTADRCTSANREEAQVDDRSDGIGFRLARVKK
ncbi:MAG: formylglycine-generating enzyme family protein [Acidobacteriota bacterium]